MSFPAFRYPETPVIQPIPIRTKAKFSMSDYPSSPSSSSSSSVCQCCASPPTFADPPSTPAANVAPAAPFDHEQNPSPATVTDSLLQRLEIRPAASDCVQAIAVASRDQRVTDNWVLITLLCHRLFGTFGGQGCIRNLNTYFYQDIGPGETLVITARRVAQSRLAWLEATISANNLLVATGTALYDGPRHIEPREMSRLTEPNDLISDLDDIGASWGPSH